MTQKYEYREDVLDLRAGASLTRHLEGMAEDRWEFVTWVPADFTEGGIVVLLRRPK